MSEETEKKEGKKTEEQRFEYRASEMYYAGSLDFMYACRTGDAVFSGAGLMFIYGSIEEGKYFEDSSEYFILKKLAYAFMVFRSLEKGEDCGDYDISGLFAPFGYAPEKFLGFFRKTGDDSTAVRRYLLEVVNFLDSLSTYPEKLRSVTVEYLNTWLSDFISVIGPYYDSIREDGNLGKLFSFIIREPGTLPDAMMKMTVVFGRHMGEIEEAYTGDAEESFLNTAVRYNNKPCFERLLELGTFSTDSIVSYPTEDMKILEKLVELGVLLPGAEEGRAAFFHLISETDPGEEMITAVLHPSYFESCGKAERTPLVAAIRNAKFSPEKYRLLVRGKNDVNSATDDGIPPLGYAIATGSREKVREVLKLGAHIFFRDSDGRNIPYILLAREIGRPEDILYASPDILFGDYSRDGLLPIHSILGNTSNAGWLEKFRKTGEGIERGKTLWTLNEDEESEGDDEASVKNSSDESASFML